MTRQFDPSKILNIDIGSVTKKDFWCVILGNEILKIENSVSDRRKASVSVENDRRSGIDRRAIARAEEKPIELHHSAVVSAMSVIPSFRRLSCCSDDIKKGEYAAAGGLASLALINSTADFDDIKESYKQVKSWFIKGSKFEHAYDHKMAQHPFSFFRGTLLHKGIDKIRKYNPELAEKIVDFDITLGNTKFGDKMRDILKIENIGSKETTIKSFEYTATNPQYIYANMFKGGFFGEMTARAMERTSIIGLCVLGALELPKIIKSMKKGDNIFEQTASTTKQTAKSAINIASLAAGVGYFGALGSKMHGNVGSLVGMGIGAMAGSYVSEKVQKIID